ncbi:hypothetical protein [Halodesulfovibrio marinisediminis]|uniref:Type IV pilus biogenesis protein PilP n=1 Tax=Halodesulfovibrio marinisediminis DSM 17456 TaxID=1121457 RepID=A0A1N6FEL4_9BACT|nr:hypothetical protein [Halodesulfovibrio marinisediminis]SIN93695.1 hypothetical protein SAMN02745161_1273 [Halodesulfovibrio marinisediminis DSM 17456]
MRKTNLTTLALLLCFVFAATVHAAPKEEKKKLQAKPATQEEAQKATKQLTQLFNSGNEKRPAAQQAAGHNTEKKPSLSTPKAKKEEKASKNDGKIDKPIVDNSKDTKKVDSNKPTLSPEKVAHLSALDFLKSKLEILNVKVEIAQKEKRLKDLNQEIRPVVTPKVYHLPRPKTKKRSTPPVVLSVQGIEDQLTATLQFQSTGKPVRTVSAGDRLSSGTISSIAYNRVTVKTTNGVITLPFKE